MRIIRIALLLFLAVIASSWISSVEAKPVNFAANTPTLSGTLPLIVGQEFGFFAAEGLEVKTVFIRGGPTAMAALVGGGVDYTLVAGVAAVRGPEDPGQRGSPPLIRPPPGLRNYPAPFAGSLRKWPSQYNLHDDRG